MNQADTRSHAKERAERIVKEWGKRWGSRIADTPIMLNLIDAIAAALIEAREAERICPKCGIRIDHECGGLDAQF